MRPLLNQQWGTQQPILLSLPGFGLAELRAFGQTGYRISDPATFLRQMVGTTGLLEGVHLRQYLRGVVLSAFSEALTRAQPTAEALMGNLSGMDKALLEALRESLGPLGLEMVQFVTESISLPPAVRDELFKYSRLPNVNMDKLTQFALAEAIPTMAAQSGEQSGVVSQAVQLSVALAVSKQILEATGAGALQGLRPASAGTGVMVGTGNTVPQSSSVEPPPLPAASPRR